MHLKKLEILGFKSFADKTTVSFADGMTAIVGPNGCGKTNILDALRWVLGEQKVSLLRGSKMEEVIFNGTRDVKPLGMSEVTLTIVNDRGVLPTEYGVVQITRRLFRSGDSEYLMNKVPCRLKDIHELFFDTGMGAHSYSVIQQDMIESVISDKAEERRFLFEEAAGITKYKQRKKAAERKLEATENDFLRLRDIYSEVKTRVNSLNRQVKKAERYKTVADEIKAWELYLGGTRLRQIETERRENRARLDDLTGGLSERRTRIDSSSATLEDQHRRQIDIEHELTAVGHQAYEMTERAHDMEKEITLLNEKRSNSRVTIDRNRSEIDSHRARQEELGQQVDLLQEELRGRQDDLSRVAAELREAEAAQAAADERLLTARSRRESTNAQLLELEGKLSSGKAEDESLREQMADLESAISDHQAQLQVNQTRLTELMKGHEAATEKRDRLSSDRSDTEHRLKQTGEQIESLVEESESLKNDIANLQASLEAAQARRNMLEDMIVHYEGYESGVVTTMEERERFPGVMGTVAEAFVPVAGMETAVEASLGEVSRFILCRDRQTAEQIILYLRENKKGKIGMLVPHTGTINAAVKRPEIDVPEFVGWLDGFVSTADDALRPLKEAVLARVAVIEDNADPSELLKRLPYGFKAVSRDGRVYTDTSVAGGSSDNIPLFRRQEKLKEQEEAIEDITRKLAETNERKNKVTAEIAHKRAESHRLSDALSEVTEELQEAQRQLTELGYRRETTEKESSRLQRERSTLQNKLESIRGRQYSLGLNFDQLSSAKKELVETLTESGDRLEDLEKAASGAVERVSSLQLRQVETRSRVEQTESRISHLADIRSELRTTIETKQKEIEEAEHTISQSTARIGELERELKQVFEERERITARQKELQGQQAEIMEQVNAAEKQLKQLRQEKDEYGEQVHKLEMTLQTLDSETQSISERIREEYDLDIREVSPERPESDIEDSDARKHLSELKERLRGFGAVNLLALEEFDEASKREAFLGEQLTDLEAAKNDLKDTITRINQTARQLFAETFEKVRQNFQRLFVELFTGGEADIALVDPSDPLESDIEITARPRGKKILSITMMSGGERALTAISLLFSLYLVKPSPFCILDEIDAPLDDANCRRFLRIIRNFSAQTQFIIITHNKITMEASDNLYGVTMELPGVSKLVGVKFHQDEVDGDSSAALVVTDEASDALEPVTTAEKAATEQELPESIASRLRSEVSVGDDKNDSDN